MIIGLKNVLDAKKTVEQNYMKGYYEKNGDDKRMTGKEHWLDPIIKKQKNNTDIIRNITDPYDPADLQQIAEYEGWETTDKKKRRR